VQDHVHRLSRDTPRVTHFIAATAQAPSPGGAAPAVPGGLKS